MFLPGTRGGTSPAQPICGPGMHGCQSQTAQIRRDDGLTASPPGSSAEGGRQKDWETSSHRRTLQSGRGGRESGKHRIHRVDQFGHLFTDTNLNAHQIPAVLFLEWQFVDQLTFLGKRWSPTTISFSAMTRAFPGTTGYKLREHVWRIHLAS